MVVVGHRGDHHGPHAAKALALCCGRRRWRHHGGERREVAVVKVTVGVVATGGSRSVRGRGAFHSVATAFLSLVLRHAGERGGGGLGSGLGGGRDPPSHRRGHLLGLLHGDREGLDWTDLEVRELVLRLLSGLLREHTLTMETAVLRHTSHTHSFLHLLKNTGQSDLVPHWGGIMDHMTHA